MSTHFVIKTYHKSLKYLLQPKVSPSFQQFWQPKLMGFDYKIQYKCGKENIAVDALSRVQGAQILSMAIFILYSDSTELTKASYVLDDGLVQILDQLQHSPTIGHDTIHYGLLRRKGKLVVESDRGF